MTIRSVKVRFETEFVRVKIKGAGGEASVIIHDASLGAHGCLVHMAGDWPGMGRDALAEVAVAAAGAIVNMELPS